MSNDTRTMLVVLLVCGFLMCGCILVPIGVGAAFFLTASRQAQVAQAEAQRALAAQQQARIQAEISRVISNLRAKVAVSEQRLGSLTSSLGGAQSRLEASNAAMVGLDELERKALASQGLYEAYLNSYKQLVASEGIRTPNARVLTLADAPSTPSSPNVSMIMALSVVIGFGAGLIAAFVV